MKICNITRIFDDGKFLDIETPNAIIHMSKIPQEAQHTIALMPIAERVDAIINLYQT